jgi:hypothetical protein
MTDGNQKQSNSALWWGLLITVLGVLSNFLYPFRIPQGVIPWINLIVPAIGLLFLLVGLRRAFSRSQAYRGKVWGSIVTGLSVLIFGASVWGFFHERDVPRSANAPQVGQRVPDFALSSSTGQQISLAQLFSSEGTSPRPKAVLLIFYRGYW